MTDDQMTDLKQFVSVSFAQRATELRTDIVELLGGRIDRLDARVTARIDELTYIVGDALDSCDDATDVPMTNHEQHIRRSEKKFSA